MAKIIRLTESDLTRIVRRVINEQIKGSPLDIIKTCVETYLPKDKVEMEIQKNKQNLPQSCKKLGYKISAGSYSEAEPCINDLYDMYKTKFRVRLEIEKIKNCIRSKMDNNNI